MRDLHRFSKIFQVFQHFHRFFTKLKGGGTVKTFGRKGVRKPGAFDPNKHKTKRSKSAKNVTQNGTKNGKKKGKLKKSSWSQYDVTGFKKKKVTQQQMDELNFAINEEDEGNTDEGGNGVNTGNGDQEEGADAFSMWTPDGDANFEETSDESSEDDFSDLLVPNGSTADNTDTKGGGMASGIWNRFSKLIGNKPLEEQDVVTVLKNLEDSLSSKNVANVIAKELCDSVKSSLIGTIFCLFIFC